MRFDVYGNERGSNLSNAENPVTRVLEPVRPRRTATRLLLTTCFVPLPSDGHVVPHHSPVIGQTIRRGTRAI